MTSAEKPYLQQLPFIFLVAIFVLLPIYRGGNVVESYALLFISVGGLLILSPLKALNDGQWLIVWAVFSLGVVLQSFWLSKTLTSITGMPIASVGFRTFQFWAYFTSMLFISWKVSSLTAVQIAWLMWVLLLSSLFQATFGLVHYLTEARSVLGIWQKEYYLFDATGTFVNRNHFAGMLAMSWPIILSALIAKRPLLFRSIRHQFRVAIAFFYSTIIFIAILSSHSRMGIVVAIIGIIVCGIFLTREAKINRESSINLTKLMLLVGGLFLLLFALWFGVEDIAERYTKLENGNSRVDVWRAMFDFPSNIWLLGIGPGQFEDVFHLVQPSYLNVRFVYAHNDYLEFILEFGLILSAIIFISFAYLIYKQFPRGGLGRRAGVFGALTAIILHSTVDFNMQIPGSASIAWLAFGLLLNPNMRGDALSITDIVDSSLVSAARVRKPLRGMSKKRFALPKNRQEWLAFFKSD